MPRGTLATFLASIKNMTWRYNSSYADIMSMIPFEYELLQIMINSDLEQLAK